jgi:hypothetical protein
VTPRLLTVALIALPCVLGAHLAALLLFALTVAVVGLHLLPVLASVALVGFHMLPAIATGVVVTATAAAFALLLIRCLSLHKQGVLLWGSA